MKESETKKVAGTGMIDLASIFDTCNQIPLEAKRLADIFVSPDGIGRRYLLGRNEHSAALAGVIDVDGFVDDYSGQGTTWNGKPVVGSGAVPKDAILVNCVMCNMPVTAGKRIRELSIHGGLAYSDLLCAYPSLIPAPVFVADTNSDVRQYLDKWQALSSSLADEQSKTVLNDLLSFRLTGNCSSMDRYSFRPKDQYFEDFLRLGTGDVFVDAGGFDGDTTEEFCTRYPDYEKVFLFEPSPNNLAKAQARLKGHRGIEFFPLGLSDSEGKVGFNPDGGSASNISSSGPCQIDVTTLDRYIDERVTFIKMDLEGWELKALQGARRHICEDFPRLAIAVYHHPSDFWRIYEYVTDLRGDYRVFLRHYTEGWSETVMYFVPGEDE